MERKNEVLDVGIVNDAISKVLVLYADEGLTVAEAIQATDSVKHALDARYPSVRKVMDWVIAGTPGVDGPGEPGGAQDLPGGDVGGGEHGGDGHDEEQDEE